MEIYIDGGIRRGTDVLKALALGARAVGLGRPFLYSLAAGYGEAGVRRGGRPALGEYRQSRTRGEYGAGGRNVAGGDHTANTQHAEAGAGLV